jgi:hypothetical protein
MGCGVIRRDNQIPILGIMIAAGIVTFTSGVPRPVLH